MARGVFITGTGTEVGKTYVTCLIARQLTALGKKVGVYKPAASGCETVNGKLASGDAIALWEAAGKPLSLHDVCPQRFAAPLAPHLAAQKEGRAIDAALLRTGIEPWLAGDFDTVLVEGAGGLLSPVSDDDYNADLAADLGLPLIVVAANRLGVINDTLQTAVTASVWGDGLDVSGVVLNRATADSDESCESNADQLRRHLRQPLLAEVAYGADSLGEVATWSFLTE